jgi:hypothetical protein
LLQKGRGHPAWLGKRQTLSVDNRQTLYPKKRTLPMWPLLKCFPAYSSADETPYASCHRTSVMLAVSAASSPSADARGPRANARPSPA